MSEDEALNRASEILSGEVPLTKDLIDEFYGLEPFIADYKFGDLIEALMVITPRSLLSYV